MVLQTQLRLLVSITDYSVEIWRFNDFSKCNNVHNRAMRYYLDLHKFAPVAGMQGDLGWLSPKYRHYGCMLRYWNRLCTRVMTD